MFYVTIDFVAAYAKIFIMHYLSLQQGVPAAMKMFSAWL